jgi:hypothetical protein
MLISKNFLTREASYKPSYFISCSQSGPSGTVVDLVGRQVTDMQATSDA